MGTFVTSKVDLICPRSWENSEIDWPQGASAILTQECSTGPSLAHDPLDQSDPCRPKIQAHSYIYKFQKDPGSPFLGGEIVPFFSKVPENP